MKFDVTYVYSFEDYRSIYRANHQLQPIAWAMSYLSLILLAAVLRTSVQEEPLLPDFSDLSWVISARELIRHPVVLAVIWFSFVRLALLRLAYRQLSKAGKKVDYAIADDGISWRQIDGPSGNYPWKSFSAMTSLKDGSALVLWLARNEGVVLPSRAFSSADEFRVARDFISRKISHNSATT